MTIASSPRWWGCSVKDRFAAPEYVNLPHAGGGVPLNSHSGSFPLQHLPHAGGGVPATIWEHWAEMASSPRWWGCSGLETFRLDNNPPIFPTLVGVFRQG